MKAPCKGCPDRAVGCHGKCEQYTAYREIMERERNRRRVEAQANDATARAVERVSRYKWNTR